MKPLSAFLSAFFARCAVHLFLFTCTAAAAHAVPVLPPDPDVTIGRTVPFDGFVDQNGTPFRAAPEARPWIVSPIYTRCANTCSALTASLAAALRDGALATSDYRVLSLSFDPRETDASLADFRTRMHLPPDWLTLRAVDPAALDATLRSLDFRTIQLDGGVFEHPNLVVVLDPERRVIADVFGVAVSPTALAGAVSRARTGASALDRWRPYLFLLATVGFLASTALFLTLLERTRRPRSTGAVDHAP